MQVAGASNNRDTQRVRDGMCKKCRHGWALDLEEVQQAALVLAAVARG